MIPEPPRQTRYTFAVGLCGPSSDGDRGEYYVTSLTLPAEDVIRNESTSSWAERQLLEQLEAQGQEVSFVKLLSEDDIWDDDQDDQDDDQDDDQTPQLTPARESL